MHVNLGKTFCFVALCSIFGLSGTTQAMAAAPDANAVNEVQQAKKVTGRVSDTEGTLIGATVLEKGTSNGVVTDFDGNFTIDVKPGATLVISYVGYVTQEVRVGNQSILNIVLEAEGGNLNEVVVIGYGTQRREAVTGSVVNVNGEKLNQIAATNAAQALQGRVAGVLMTQAHRARRYSFHGTALGYQPRRHQVDGYPQGCLRHRYLR